MKYILFTGGGSAGHVVPNLAIMNELKYSYKVAYMGTNGIERALVEKHGYPFLEVNCPKLQRRLTLSNLKIPFALRKAVKTAEEFLREDTPDLVFSKGGYASFPAARAAQKLHIPVLTHESDLSAGLCTKLLARRCESVLTSFPETAQKFKTGKHVGSPMRKEIFGGERSRARRKYSLSGEKPVLLVLGGGSGSKALNEFIHANLPKLLNSFEILHLCGKGNEIQSHAHGYVQREFESDMGSAYACADFVLARAGSNTVFELLALKKPTLFVPLEKSSRGDQLQNAEYFSKKGLCRILRENELSLRGMEALHLTANDEKLKYSLAQSDIKNGTPAIAALIKQRLL